MAHTLDEMVARYVATDEGGRLLREMQEAEAAGAFDFDRERWDEAYEALEDGFLSFATEDGKYLAEIDRWTEEGVLSDALWDVIL